MKKQTLSPAGKPSGTQQEILDYGMKYLNTPYRYAARGPHAFDCSGFTSFVFKEFGYKLSASSSGQGKQLPSINNRKDLRKGDLVFFEGRAHNGKIGHVGIVKDLLPNGEFTFLHASTSNGVIVSRSTEVYYASRYLHGGRVLNENNQVIVAENTKKEAEGKLTERVKSGKKQQQTHIQQQNEVAAPKTATQKQLETQSEQNTTLAEKSDQPAEGIVIHSRPSYLPPVQTQSQNNNTNADRVPQISKDVRRSNETQIPEPKVEESKNHSHEVKPGDTLFSIARKYDCTVDQLRSWNPHLKDIIRSGEVIRVGQ